MSNRQIEYYYDTSKGNGFTLLELLVAIAIFAIVISLIYPAYIGTYRNIEVAETQVEIYQMARITLDRIIDDLESANIPDRSESSVFSGKDELIIERNSDSLRFISRSHISFGDKPTVSGNAKISYYVRENENTNGFVLYRSDILKNREWSEDETGGLILCENLYSINFTYYDSKGNSHDYWDSNNTEFEGRLPSMVSIMIEFYDKTDPERPVKFSTAVALPLAEREI